ncbi:MAG: DEAD/DEAH box helicase [Chthoniobacterales bacterium]
MLTFETPLAEVVLPPQLKLLARLGLLTVGDVLSHYPKRHEDRTRFDQFPNQEMEKPVCICGLVRKTNLRRFGGYKKMFDAVIEAPDGAILSSPITLRWFNLHYVQKMIAVGQRVVVFGRPRVRGKSLCIEHPEFEIIEDDADASLNLERIVPIYPATEGMTQRAIRKLVDSLLTRLEPLPDWLPAGLSDTGRDRALRNIHFPPDAEALEEARRHLVLTEFFGLQLQVARRRSQTHALPGEAHCGSGKLLARLLQALPFPLTGAQERVIGEIRADLAAPHPMNRLLQGDVGSGKTFVALAAILLAVEAGFQTALMAPTQILAEQHYLNFTRLLEPLGVHVALRTGSRKEDNETLPLFDGAPSSGSARVSRVDLDVSSKSEIGYRFTRRRLPHYERPYGIYAVTFATHERETLSPEERNLVFDAVIHFHNKRYELFAACVMPDHVHLLLEPFVKDRLENGNLVFYSLAEITHSIKSFTAHQMNAITERKGPVWQKESFDRLMRTDREAEEKFHYILKNPVRAGVVSQEEDYPWRWTQEALSRDAKGNTRDACAPVPHLFIGTHALLYDSVEFSNLGLVVIDEQHKFGVMQRAKLISRRPTPDVLVMTATPIPRTLTMTAYGDLDVSILDELPPGRGRIKTELREEGALKDPAKFKSYLAAGNQAYVVCPLIDEGEKTDAKAATQEYEKWSAFLAPLKCELLHGRIPPEEKDAIMRRFRSNETQVLVATTVIEVGIDVPNATVMIIEDAEKFGLAQLHQLRGRIGRGAKTSFCILLTRTKDPAALEKLRTLAATTDGFAIAEADLNLRGPGDILGTAQSGLPPLKIGNILHDRDLMLLARQKAMELVSADPELARPENIRLRALVINPTQQTFSHVS